MFCLLRDRREQGGSDCEADQMSSRGLTTSIPPGARSRYGAPVGTYEPKYDHLYRRAPAWNMAHMPCLGSKQFQALPSRSCSARSPPTCVHWKRPVPGPGAYYARVTRSGGHFDFTTRRQATVEQFLPAGTVPFGHLPAVEVFLDGLRARGLRAGTSMGSGSARRLPRL